MCCAGKVAGTRWAGSRTVFGEDEEAAAVSAGEAAGAPAESAGREEAAQKPVKWRKLCCQALQQVRFVAASLLCGKAASLFDCVLVLLCERWSLWNSLLSLAVKCLW